MKAVINRKTYNTETATLVYRKNFSTWGDPAGYSEDLMKTKSGNYFIYGVGGTESKYPEPVILPITAKEAAKFQKED